MFCRFSSSFKAMFFVRYSQQLPRTALCTCQQGAQPSSSSLNLPTLTLPRPGRWGFPWDRLAAELLPPAAPPGAGEAAFGLSALCTASSTSAGSRISIVLQS